MHRYFTNFCHILVSLIIIAFTTITFAVEIKGTVVAVEGQRAKIEYGPENAPRVGDRIRIGDEIDGMFIPVAGE